MALKVTYKKHTVELYDKKDVLIHLCCYAKWREDIDMFLKNRLGRTILYKAQHKYGRQFLLDLFIAGEEYIHHSSDYAIHCMWADITYVMTRIPTYRLLYESN